MATLDDLRTVARDSSFFDKVDTKSTRVIDRAVNTALRLVAQSFNWEFYNTIGRINTVEQQSSGTVAIANGGSTVTLTGATWPTDLTDYSIRINSEDVDHGFSVRDGATTGTLISGQIWNGDTQTTASYVLYRSRYDLAGDCRKFGEFQPQNLDWDLTYISKEAFEAQKNVNISFTGDPVWVSHDNTYAYFWPPTDAAKAVLYNYDRWPASASTGGDSIDWDTTRMDMLYAAMDIAIKIHQDKLSWANGLNEVRNVAHLMSGDEPKRSARNYVRSMYGGGDFPRHRLEWGGNE